MKIANGFNIQIEHLMFGGEIQFLNPHITDIIFIQLGIHDCEGCWTLNATLLGFHIYIGWMKNSGMDLLRDRLREIRERDI